MKVLFAVSSESISEAIIKRYQKEYKEILSFKNVYYFNAILKEIQKDKTYDRIIISEDLEPFSNNNYDTIDKFIFEKLDSISDEAHDSQGKETSIILICTDRRVKGSSILVKLFGIGVYNALLGNDRSMDEVCKLISRPRSKKEAKIYYRIDSEDVNYKAENENEVSEVEIQNILAHFKKLGRNTAKYSESFNNIASQYTDEQLRIIVNCLPINVKAVLEGQCERYQELMAVTGKIPSVKSIVGNSTTIEGITKNEISSKSIGHAGNITKPIVIPSAVRNAKSAGKPVARPAQATTIQKPVTKTTTTQVQGAVKPQPVAQQQATQQQVVKPQQVVQKPQQVATARPGVSAVKPTEKVAPAVQKQPEVKKPNDEDILTGLDDLLDEEDTAVSTPNKKPEVKDTSDELDLGMLSGLDDEEPVSVKDPLLEDDEEETDDLLPGFEDVEEDGTDDLLPGFEDVEEDGTDDLLPGFEDVEEDGTDDLLPGVKDVEEDGTDDLLPGFEDVEEDGTDDLLPGFEDVEEDGTDNLLSGFEDVEEDGTQDTLPGLEDIEEPADDVLPGLEDSLSEDADEPKRGRGRPRKTPVGGMVLKPKGKRGRPRKIVEGEGQDEVDEVTLPGLDDLSSFGENEEVEDTLPGLEDDVETTEDVLPGFEEETVVDNTSLPGLGDLGELDDVETSEEDILPGFEVEKTTDELADLGLDSEEVEYEDVVEDNLLGGEVIEEDDGLGAVNLEDEDYTDEVALPGLDDLEEYSDEGTMLDGPDELDDLPEIDGLGGGLDAEEEDGGLLPGLGNSQVVEEEETLLPGMGFEDEEADTLIPQRPMPKSTADNSSLESIKPRVDYSMSSLNSLISKDKKIVTFIGTSKNGNSFLVNNLASLFSSLGINTAILDMTKNKNSYFIFTKNEEELRTIAYNSIEKLQNGYAEGVKVDKNLTVYTDVPASGKDYSNAELILSTLVQNHSLILIDCDYDTDISYFACCQEMYLVQSMDILTIQPLTAFLRELKTRGVLEPEKIRVVINKEMKIHKKVGDKDIIGGLAYYNDPAMSFMTELFNKDTVKAISIPFDAAAYARYLGGIVDCEVSLNGYSKQFLSKLKLLGDMVYPLTSKQSYNSSNSSARVATEFNPNTFSNSMNNTLSKMRKKY